MARGIAFLCAAILCFGVCVSLASVKKPYPAPLFAWSSSASVLSSGRKWVSRSVSSLEVQGAVVGLAKQEVPSTLFQELSSSPELIVLFLEPNMVFGQTASYGGSRVTGVADARAIKNLIEAAKASVVAPYTYDLSMTSMNEIEHSEELEESMVEFILEFLLTSEACSVLVDLRDTSVDPWTYVLESVASDRFVDVSKEKEIFTARPELVQNGVSDLMIVVLPDDAAASATRLSTVLNDVKSLTDDYVALLSSDDLYIPSKSSESLRESNTKLDWVLRELELEDDNETQVKPCHVYNTRWPEYVWEILIVIFLLVTIAIFGLCCLLGLENPSHFDNPKEKCL